MVFTFPSIFLKVYIFKLPRPQIFLLNVSLERNKNWSLAFRVTLTHAYVFFCKRKEGDEPPWPWPSNPTCAEGNRLHLDLLLFVPRWMGLVLVLKSLNTLVPEGLRNYFIHWPMSSSFPGSIQEEFLSAMDWTGPPPQIHTLKPEPPRDGIGETFGRELGFDEFMWVMMRLVPL